MKQVTMITGNLGKWKIASKIFEGYSTKLLHQKINVPEIQSLDIRDVSLYSAEYAASLLNKPVIKSDVGYYIEALGGFPGPFIKYINEMLTSENILEMLKNNKNRKVILRECLTFSCPGFESKQFINEEEAQIAIKAEGEGTTFDKIIILKGQKHSKAVNSEKDNYNHFLKTLHIYHEMAEYLESLDDKYGN